MTAEGVHITDRTGSLSMRRWRATLAYVLSLAMILLTLADYVYLHDPSIHCDRVRRIVWGVRSCCTPYKV